MDKELIFWIVAGIASVIGFGLLYLRAKRESANYIDWMVEE